MTTLTPQITALLARAATAEHLIVASDFDGTLAFFHDDPMAVRPLAGTIEALQHLACLPHTTSALVSGRDLATLAHLTDNPHNITLIASHGAQSNNPRIADETPLTDTQQAALAHLNHLAHTLKQRYPGITIENKSAAVVIHVRQLPPEQRKEAIDAAITTIRTHTNLEPLLGKNVVETAVLHATKGGALTTLASLTHPQTALVYFGDDLTDETVFETFHDPQTSFTFKVGDGLTSATTRLPDPHYVLAALTCLTHLRTQHTQHT
ncbi:trehalose-phosphatase [Dermatophilus congolensis]|uniref:trehalose-phosphatase n=2 Tax=Dermatophilus congolensis TaxID=1863 RepID=UPI001AAEB199|nr:trehalose-phosphatase [Dermatophilus congolensis]MBO3142076.1 trehalose-phosphatase [Dermatophilus congolensis]MBO3151067.1 trehalose-phosphatase [Dermatophilus congolensis]MBO3161928.1 trehalose-phosphatase [Dermatophilus congolensis]MBO3162354.1 trehalose-phosphatase [Dermatophilus congolensis]MBO3182667.1 trehalose-phosphatase [Dermatophilus congolensis]